MKTHILGTVVVGATIDTLSGNNAAEVQSSKKNDKPEMCRRRKPHHKTDLHNYGATESVGLHALHNFGELFLKLAIGIIGCLDTEFEDGVLNLEIHHLKLVVLMVIKIVVGTHI